MMADLPEYEYDEEKKGKDIKITDQNADDFLKMFQS